MGNCENEFDCLKQLQEYSWVGEKFTDTSYSFQNVQNPYYNKKTV